MRRAWYGDHVYDGILANTSDSALEFEPRPSGRELSRLCHLRVPPLSPSCGVSAWLLVAFALGLFRPVALDKIQRYMVEEHPGVSKGKRPARSAGKAPGR